MCSSPEYDSAALSVIGYEFGFSDKGRIDAQIREELLRKGLGAFDATRINLLRRFKDSVQAEVTLGPKSKYYKGAYGKFDSQDRQYSDFRDFDSERMAVDYAAEFPEITEKAVKAFVGFAVYLYYLR